MQRLFEIITENLDYMEENEGKIFAEIEGNQVRLTMKMTHEHGMSAQMLINSKQIQLIVEALKKGLELLAKDKPADRRREQAGVVAVDSDDEKNKGVILVSRFEQFIIFVHLTNSWWRSGDMLVREPGT